MSDKRHRTKLVLKLKTCCKLDPHVQKDKNGACQQLEETT